MVREEGSFLVRESSSSVGDYAVSVLSAGVVHHVQIQRHEGDAFFSIAGGPIIHGLDELIKYYQSPSSLGDDDILLQKAIIKSPPPPDGRHTVRILLQDGNANPQIRRNDNGWVPMHEAAFRGHLMCVAILREYYAPLRPRTLDHKLPIHLAIEENKVETIQFFDTVKSRKAISNRDDWYHGRLGRQEALKKRIPHELVELGESLGGGEYGEVFEGKLTMGNSGTVIDVAVKTLKNDEGQMNEWTMKEFLREAKVMMELEHEHIVKIIGITCEPKIFMVQELLALGSLQAFLLDHPDQVMPDRDLRKWAHEIAKGMVYLQRKRFVHRDLAARNILLSKDRVAKISDFGLSRALGGNSDYYTATHGGRWPIKWYAPESCSHGTFSHASDVWSFAVTLWELYSFGETPFGQETTGREVIEMVERGERLDKPKHCPDKIYSVMKKCWNMDPDLRPTFTFLENFFANPILAAMVPSSTESSTTPEQPSSSQQHVHDDNLMIDLNDNNDGGGVTYTNTIERPRPRPSVPGGTATGSLSSSDKRSIQSDNN
ncbi:Tyrosine-protein kinase HTK16 [Folsomia candida]|uniref:Tyrosine-protein kinase n=1 Tax=Folsomia candida TaxID=158441 RepID=A0A226D344_FOLCA|nr:Tyrosine-protein kinase HTK16 [Folsomia candida]